MKTVLVLAQHPELFDNVRGALSPDDFRVVQRLDAAEAEPLLHSGLIDICLIDVEHSQVQGLWTIEKVRQALPHCLLLVYTGKDHWEFEEEAYVNGVSHVLSKPFRPRLLTTLLERAEQSAPANWSPRRPASSQPGAPLVSPRGASSPQATSLSKGQSPQHPTTVRALEVLRDFSGILTHSLKADALLHQFLIQLREILGVNRAAIFLRRPENPFGKLKPGQPEPGLKSACAVGLPQELLEHFELSFESGIGWYLYHEGRILQRDHPEAMGNPDIRKEFELLGTQVAIPILDRETLVGIAVFDGRVTGEALANGELELIFHLLEQFGLAVKNIWLHEQLSTNHEMLADILRELNSACILVNRDLAVLHANEAAQKLFGKGSRRSAPLEFSDLPQFLGSKLYQVLKTGNALATFKYEPGEHAAALFNVTILPFHEPENVLPKSALMVVEDQTQTERLNVLQIEAEQLRLVRRMADRLAHEIGNAMVPMATHQQLLKERYRDTEFRNSLDVALTEGVKRVTRLVNQMRYLARESTLSEDAFPLLDLLKESFTEAHTHHPAESPSLACPREKQPLVLKGDRAALKHAFAEVMLNALQANKEDASVGVSLKTNPLKNGHQQVQIEIVDQGAGFSAEALTKVPTPFFSTKTVGLGLGLSVCKKIIDLHHGSLEIVKTKPSNPGRVRIVLPMNHEGDSPNLKNS